MNIEHTGAGNPTFSGSGCLSAEGASARASGRIATGETLPRTASFNIQYSGQVIFCRNWNNLSLNIFSFEEVEEYVFVYAMLVVKAYA